MIFPWGTLVNAAAIIAGSLLGLLCGSRLPERVRSIVFQGLGLCVMLIGIKMALITAYPLILIFSILLGSIIGSLLKFEDIFIKGGEKLKAKLKSRNPKFTEGMVNSAILFCIGAMAILGSFDEGLRGDRNVLFTKSILDGFAAMAMASAYGVGVLFSAFFVFAYQGLLTVFAGSMQDMLSPPVMNELTATGGVLIIGIGINLLELTRIPLSNMLLALVLVIVIASIFI